MKLTLAIVFSLCLSLAFAQQARSGFNSVIVGLQDFQNTDGGFFQDDSHVSSLAATHNALFLSSLFGMRDHINSAAVSKFLESVKNADGGFSDSVGQPATLTAVKDALSVDGYLGLNAFDKQAVANWVKGHYDATSKLFANKKAEKPSIAATATAFQILDLLSSQRSEWATKAATEVQSILKAHLKGSSFAFPEESLDEVAGNYYGILAGSLVGFQFEDPAAWASFFTVRQSKSNGGFFAVQSNPSSHSVLATQQAVAAIHYLTKATGADLKTAIDTKGLAQYLRNIPHKLADAALAHSAVSRTSLFPELFQKTASFEALSGGIRGQTIVVGSQLTPVLSVDTLYGLPHPGLSVEVVVTHKGGEKKIPLRFSQDANKYVSDEVIDTTDKLGAISATYNVRINLVGETIDFTMEDEKSVGFNIRVEHSAHLADKELPQGAPVSAGTSFNFALQLSTGKVEKITKGDFDVVFSVLDSAEILLHTESKDCRGSEEPLAFKYTLKSINFPVGALVFRFQVKNADGVHTEHYLGYGVTARMAATEITYDSAKDYKIGETFEVSMLPASLPDMTTVTLYPYKDAAGNAALKRNLYLDVYGLEDEIAVRNIKGDATESNGFVKYTFKLPITPSFASIGKHRFAFRYVPYRGSREVTLSNYDSKTGELFDESHALTFAVKADLQVTALEKPPTEGNLSYGNDIAFSFKVVDAISNQDIWVEGNDVALTLTNTDSKGKSYVSDKVYATQGYDQTGAKSSLKINWSVSPNAVKGAGVLGLVAEIASGEAVPLVKASDKKPWQVKVVIGGEITATHHVETLSAPDGTHNTFLVTFQLKCQGKLLTGAHLRAAVTQVAGVPVSDFFVPVARQGNTATHSLSWLANDEQAQSGAYTVQIYREVDAEGEPLFQVHFDFAALHSNFLPFRTETLVLFLAIAGLAVFSYKKYQIESRK